MKKKAPIKLNPANKGATRKRVGVSKATGKIKTSALNKDISKQKRAVKAASPGTSTRKSAVKKLRQDLFARNFSGKKK